MYGVFKNSKEIPYVCLIKLRGNSKWLVWMMPKFGKSVENIQIQQIPTWSLKSSRMNSDRRESTSTRPKNLKNQ
jgi:hypothetical protein